MKKPAVEVEFDDLETFEPVITRLKETRFEPIALGVGDRSQVRVGSLLAARSRLPTLD
jgi:hypothetical protein